MVSIIHTDAALWFDVPGFSDHGYAVANPSDDKGTLNPTIWDLVDLAGTNLFAMMHREDTLLQVPPSFNTVVDIHKLYQRVAHIINAAAVPHNEPELRTVHTTIGHQSFKLYPCPFFLVRNAYMRRWAGLILTAISDMIQHTENAKAMEITENFRRHIGPIFRRVYNDMAIRLFNKTREEVQAPEFTLTDADFQAYNPSAWHTDTEMVDTVPVIRTRFTEDELKPLREGIAIADLPDTVRPWPHHVPELHGEPVPTPPGSGTEIRAGLPVN